MTCLPFILQKGIAEQNTNNNNNSSGKQTTHVIQQPRIIQEFCYSIGGSVNTLVVAFVLQRTGVLHTWLLSIL